MLVSTREAARILAEVGATRPQATRLLRAGFAGPAVRTAGSVLYDERLVRALVDWPRVDELDLAEACPRELFVARLGPTRGLDLLSPRPEQLEAAGRSRDLSPWTRLLLQLRITRHGSVPFVATVCGYVAVGADITALAVDRGSGPEQAPTGADTIRCGGDRELIRFELGEPGEWFETLRGRRLRTGRGGPWILWDRRRQVG
jgi:hypothetical protein